MDPDKQHQYASEASGTNLPTQAQVNEALSALAERACEPFDAPQLRNTLVGLKRRSEQVIDAVSADNLRKDYRGCLVARRLDSTVTASTSGVDLLLGYVDLHCRPIFRV